LTCISSKAFVAAQVQLRECMKQMHRLSMHRLSDADELAEDYMVSASCILSPSATAHKSADQILASVKCFCQKTQKTLCSEL
jgi:hypothetical protein